MAGVVFSSEAVRYGAGELRKLAPICIGPHYSEKAGISKLDLLWSQMVLSEILLREREIVGPVFQWQLSF